MSNYMNGAVFKHYLKTGRVLSHDAEFTLKPYKLPLEKVPQGFGYLGTVAQSVGKTHIQCHICGFFFRNVGQHSKLIHGVSAKQYRERFQLAKKTPPSRIRCVSLCRRLL